MMYRLRQRASDEGGFTLIELLVVILIIGILAAIAIPSFLSQRNKATDAQAKELARTAATTAETYATDNGGSYEGLTVKKLKEYESALGEPIKKSGAEAEALKGRAALVEEGTTGTATTYTIITAASDGDTYTLKREANGELVKSCTEANSSKACLSKTW